MGAVNFHLIDLPDRDGASVMIETETETEVNVPICERCGALVGDEELHGAWHEGRT